MPEEFVITPGGYRPKSLVHEIESGDALRMDQGRLLQLHPSGKIVADFGTIPSRPARTPLMPGNVSFLPTPLLGMLEVVPALGTGWIADAAWTNNTGQPITSFRTTWVVPAAPSTQSGQLLYLFNGIQNSTMIYQPVLQWGNNNAFGGNYWLVASWYADGQGGPAFHSSTVQVNPGDVLVGVMTQTGHTGTQFSYNCEFEGIANTGLPVQNIDELTWAIETLEAYKMTKCSDYPNASRTQFTSINIQTGPVNPALAWTPQNRVTDCGQHCVVVSNANPGGEVDIYYIAAPVVTWQNPSNIVYGTPLGTGQCNATASEPGTFTYNPPLGTCLPAGVHTLTVTFTPSDSTHQVVTKTVQLLVLKAAPTLVWATPANITYGTVLSGSILNAAASWVVCGANVGVPGTYIYTPPVGTVLSAGVHTLCVTFHPIDTADYNTATTCVQINVLKATPTITWATPADIDFGTALDGTQLNATATWDVGVATVTVAGTFNYTPSQGGLLSVGTHTLSVLFMPTDTANYNNATATVQINVRTGYPIVMSAQFSPTVIPLNVAHPITTVTVTVKNDSVKPHVTQGPDPGFEYSEGDTFETKGFPSVSGAYRIAVDLQETTYTVPYLYRWGLGKTLAPGESIQVTGSIRFHNKNHNGHYYVAMIQEVNQVTQDQQGTTMITVVDSL